MSSADLPQPLTPADCDLTGYRFMPLDVVRLKGSELASSYTPEACWAAMLLWCASWQHVPAGAIPDNDKWIADQAGYSQRGKIDRAWKGVRDGALHGWVKCSDGLLYHPVVAEKALEGWIGKLLSRLSGGIGNAKRWGTEFDDSGVKGQIVEACAHLQAIAPQSAVLTQKQVVAILLGSAPDSPPDKKSIAPRSKKSSPPESLGDRNREGEGEGDRKENIKPIRSSSALTVGGAGETAPDDDDSGQEPGGATLPRAVRIAILLRGLGVKPMTAQHPLAVEWAGIEECTDALLTDAVDHARQFKPAPQTIHPHYLMPIVVEKLNPPPPRHGNSWRATEQATDAKARELGITAPVGWSYAQLRDAIQAEIDRRRKQPPPEGAAA
ncbi:hypothetical protein Herbaro_09315 [Herbaspirillum sp. WKF16]|uniref:DUF1376 domain-containing protein n=1 Tax=Herbaspirillum sp. WKF16 TaxID=3028312 RepID=UPI0023A9E9F7|nr:DUF1376 domain-containing protein [Herbaspirillum sp. WKF16]WDZ97959.1 hypothetical protein Herbaro_09315 [Herbaspirillum sp. WKF16]